jgi:hypothetical protein
VAGLLPIEITSGAYPTESRREQAAAVISLGSLVVLAIASAIRL